MKRKLILYFLCASLLNPYPIVYAGSVCCKSQIKADPLKHALKEFVDAIKWAQVWKNWQNMIFFNALQQALLKGFALLEVFKNECNDPESIVPDIKTNADLLYKLFEVLYALQGQRIAAGSTDEMIYTLFVAQRADTEKETVELLSELILREKGTKLPKIKYEDFLKTRVEELKKCIAQIQKNQHLKKLAAEKFAKESDKLSCWDICVGRTVQNKRIRKMALHADKLRLAINACRENYRYKVINNEKHKFDKYLLGAFEQCFEIVRAVQSIDPEALKPFVNELKDHHDNITKKIDRQKGMPKNLYSLFLDVFLLSKDLIIPGNIDEFLNVIANSQPEYSHKPIHEALATDLGFRVSKKQMSDQKEEIDQAIKAQQECAAEAFHAKEKKALEEQMLKKIKDLEDQKKVEEEKKKIETLAAEKKAQQEREEAQRKEQADKEATKKTKKQEKKLRKAEKKLEEMNELKKIAEQSKALKEKEAAQENARKAKQLKEENEKEEAVKLKSLAFQQAVTFNQNVVDAAMERVIKDKELESRALEFKKARNNKKLKRIVLSWQGTVAQNQTKATQAGVLAKVHYETRAKNKALNRWNEALLLKQQKRLAMVFQEKENQERLLNEKLRKEFKKHQLSDTPSHIEPLMAADRTTTIQKNAYTNWFNTHLDGIIYSSAAQYLQNKSMFPASKQRIKIDCAACQAHIDTFQLEKSLASFHWSDFTRSQEYQRACQLIKMQAIAALTVAH